MNTRNLWITGGVAALGLALVALPAPPANSQTACPEESTLARLERKLEQLQAKLAGRNEQAAKLDALVSSQMALAEHRQAIDQLEAFPALAGDDDGAVGLLDGEDASWLGVELHEVTGETAKELKLPAERGVVVGSIVPDSPTAKAFWFATSIPARPQKKRASRPGMSSLRSMGKRPARSATCAGSFKRSAERRTRTRARA